jgi:hypothetical protein
MEITTRQIATVGILSAAGGGVVGAVLVALITGGFSVASKMFDADPKVTEAAIAILQNRPAPEMTNLRQWAVDAFSDRAKPALTKAQKDELIKTALPRPAAPAR